MGCSDYLNNPQLCTRHWSRCKRFSYLIWILKTFGSMRSWFLLSGECDFHKTLLEPPLWNFLHHTHIKRPCYLRFADWRLWKLSGFVGLGWLWSSRSRTVHPGICLDSSVSGKYHSIQSEFRCSLGNKDHKMTWFVVELPSDDFPVSKSSGFFSYFLLLRKKFQCKTLCSWLKK